MGFGKLLERKMIEKDVKQAELAKALGISKSTVSSIITRDASRVEIELFLKICNYLQCNPEEFFDDYVAEKKNTLSNEDKVKAKINDFLTGLSDEELNELYDYVQYLLWKRDH